MRVWKLNPSEIKAGTVHYWQGTAGGWQSSFCAFPGDEGEKSPLLSEQGAGEARFNPTGLRTIFGA